MKATKQIKREARHLFRLCIVNGTVDEGRVRQVVQSIRETKRHGYLALANQFERLIKQSQRAIVESDTALLSVNLSAPPLRSLHLSVESNLGHRISARDAKLAEVAQRDGS
jgi:hypothetical protein